MAAVETVTLKASGKCLERVDLTLKEAFAPFVAVVGDVATDRVFDCAAAQDFQFRK